MRASTDSPSPGSGAGAPTGEAFARLFGFVLLIGACLMLTFTPQQLFLAWHREGYRRTEAEVLSKPGLGRIRIEVASSGDRVDVSRNILDSSREHARSAIWYNPDANLVFGIRLFDERVLSIEQHPALPTLPTAIGLLLANLSLAAAALFLAFRPEARRRTRRQSVSRRR
mgnify:CR=1 FL=1